MMRTLTEDGRISGRKLFWIRLTARIWGSLIVAFVLLFVIGMIYNLITSGEADPNAEDDIALIEYSGPVLILLSSIGLAIAWRSEAIGGGLAVAFQLIFLILLPFQDTISLKMSFIGPLIISLIMMMPGLLYLAYWRRSGSGSSVSG